MDLPPRRSRHVSGPNHHGTRAAEPETPHGIASTSTKPLFFNDIDRWVFRCAVVLDEVVVEDSLHLLEGLEPGAAALDAEVRVEEGAVPALDDAVGQRPVDAGSLVLDVFELQERLIGMASSRPQNSRPLSESTASIVASFVSKVGSTSLLISWTAVTASLLGESRAQACRLWQSMAVCK